MSMKPFYETIVEAITIFKQQLHSLLVKVLFLTILYLAKSDTRHTLYQQYPKYDLGELPTNHPFFQDISLATEFIKEKEQIMMRSDLRLTEEEKWSALSIVLPELIRWNALKDIMETSALELLYVEKGKDKADFSIGYFQMKPSFIENLENYVDLNREDLPNQCSLILITNEDEREVRKERILRLQKFEWQIKYAYVYWGVIQHSVGNKKFSNIDDRINFFAAAYNYGFEEDERKIEEWRYCRFFPFGSRYQGEQIAYGELAVLFFKTRPELISD
jgi:hypothetical protein